VTWPPDVRFIWKMQGRFRAFNAMARLVKAMAR
jgi:hypothetical protein